MVSSDYWSRSVAMGNIVESSEAGEDSLAEEVVAGLAGAVGGLLDLAGEFVGDLNGGHGNLGGKV